MSSLDLENIALHSSGADPFALDIELSKPHEESIFAADYYEILRVSPQADDADIERVYRTLADRFHPDNPATGDAKTFLRLEEAYAALSSQARRAQYNVLRQSSRGSARLWLRGREFFDGVTGAQNRRLAMLCLLYRKRISSHDSPALSILDLEQQTGWTREEITSALWYLCEKQWATIGESTAYSITVQGFDFVESKLEERLEFRALATICHYGLPAQLENPADFCNKDTLPLDIEPAITSEGNLFLADHYEILGIGPQADEETIERVYRALAGRFHPDNPVTGDARTFLRVTEAYDALSDRAKRAQYKALRERTRYSDRFRLRGREFFDGVKGEQNRRLAVLCLLYRQAASELPGLTVLDLEQLTGCTREELGSALWYLREKKWAKSWEYAEYSITAAGFDVVENKRDDLQAAAQSQQNVAVTPQSTTANNTIAPQNPDSHRIGEGGQPDLKAGEPSEENVEAASGPTQIEGNQSVSPPASAAQPAASGQPGVTVTPQSTGRNTMPAEQAAGVAVSARKRVIFSMGGKGGVGKTSVMTGLAEWFAENQIAVTLLDLDTENKACGSLTHFYGGRVPKINIHTPAGLDAFVDHLTDDAPVILADMGAGAGQITHDWFERMYPDVAEAGAVFTAIGVVTADPASVESVLSWAAALQDRVDYVIVENSLTEHADFTYWRAGELAEEFRKRFQPGSIRMDWRLADLENAARNYGVTLGRIAGRTTPAPELQKASLVMRAQSYRRRMFAEFDRVKELLLP